MAEAVVLVCDLCRRHKPAVVRKSLDVCATHDRMTRKLHGDRAKSRRARAKKQAPATVGKRGPMRKVGGIDPRQKGYWPKVQEAIVRALAELKQPVQGIQVAERAKLTPSTTYSGLARLQAAKRVLRHGRGGRGVRFSLVKETG